MCTYHKHCVFIIFDLNETLISPRIFFFFFCSTLLTLLRKIFFLYTFLHMQHIKLGFFSLEFCLLLLFFFRNVLISLLNFDDFTLFFSLRALFDSKLKKKIENDNTKVKMNRFFFFGFVDSDSQRTFSIHFFLHKVWFCWNFFQTFDFFFRFIFKLWIFFFQFIFKLWIFFSFAQLASLNFWIKYYFKPTVL